MVSVMAGCSPFTKSFCVFQCGKHKNAFLELLIKMSETVYDTEEEIDEQNEEVPTESNGDSSIETKQIVVAVQQGQRRRVMKGMTYQTDEKHGYIYLVRTREFKSLNRSVYKVGRTSQCPDTRITRLHKYTKGSEIYLILQCHVNDVSLIEKEILEQFCKKWDPGPDGSEDFIIPTAAELLAAKQIIFDVIRTFEEKRLG
jgi:hypothetical protein